jgi:hypothetical protein
MSAGQLLGNVIVASPFECGDPAPAEAAFKARHGTSPSGWRRRTRTRTSNLVLQHFVRHPRKPDNAWFCDQGCQQNTRNDTKKYKTKTQLSFRVLLCISWANSGAVSELRIYARVIYIDSRARFDEQGQHANRTRSPQEGLATLSGDRLSPWAEAFSRTSAVRPAAQRKKIQPPLPCMKLSPTSPLQC